MIAGDPIARQHGKDFGRGIKGCRIGVPFFGQVPEENVAFASLEFGIGHNPFHGIDIFLKPD